MNTEAMRKAFETAFKAEFGCEYANFGRGTDGRYFEDEINDAFAFWKSAWQAAQANQEAIVKAALEAAANRVIHAWGPAAAESILSLVSQKILENVK